MLARTVNKNMYKLKILTLFPEWEIYQSMEINLQSVKVA